MPSIAKIDILRPDTLRALTAAERQFYAQDLEPSLLCCLEGKDPWGVSHAEIYGVAAHGNDGSLLGLAIATFRRSLYYARLLSIVLKTENSSVAEQLLSNLEETLKQENCHYLTYTYTHLDRTLEAVFKRNSWSTPQLFMVRSYFRTSSFRPAWMKIALAKKLPENVELFSWNQLSSDDRNKLAEKESEQTFPYFVSPFQNESAIEPLNSLGLRYQGDLIGWIITHRIDKDTIRYSALYADKEWRATGIPIYLLASSIALQLNSNIENGILEMNVGQVDQQWLNFVKHRLAPSAVHVERLFIINHVLLSFKDEESFL